MIKNALKNLPVNERHRHLLEDFKNYLKVMGYGKGAQSSCPSSAREFLYQLEQQGLSIEQVKSEHIKTHYAYLLERPNYHNLTGGLSSSTITGHLYGLKLLLSYLHRLGQIRTNPMSVLHFPSPKNPPRQILVKAEIDQLYQACEQPKEAALLSLFYACGLRRSEGVKLNIRDIDFRGLWLYVRSGKGKKRRVIPLTQKVANYLKTYLHQQRPGQISKRTKASDHQAFMLNSLGWRMSGGTYHLYFKTLLKRSGLKKQVSLHHLRHSIATHLLVGGMNMEKVRDFLGHEFLETTQIYTHILTQNLDLWNPQQSTSKPS